MSIYDFIKRKEGYREEAYYDPTGKVWTQGYGRTGKDVTKGSTTDEKSAYEWLVKRVDADREYVKSFADKHGYDWSPQQLDALTSLSVVY